MKVIEIYLRKSWSWGPKEEETKQGGKLKKKNPTKHSSWDIIKIWGMTATGEGGRMGIKWMYRRRENDSHTGMLPVEYPGLDH